MQRPIKPLFGEMMLNSVDALDAVNRRAFQYFNNVIEGYKGWEFTKRGANPIIGYNQALPYNDPSNQKALKDNRLRLSWHNFVFGPSVLIGGPINAWILNTR